MPPEGWNRDDMRTEDANQQIPGFSQKGRMCSFVLLCFVVQHSKMLNNNVFCISHYIEGI